MFIRVNDRDNVAIVVEAEGVRPPAAREAIPQGHKIALGAFRERRAGACATDRPSGSPTAPIAARRLGARGDCSIMPAAPPLDALPLATAVPPPLPPARRLHVRGLPQSGWRHRHARTFWASPPRCNAWRPPWSTPRGASATEILPRFPNVDDVVAITHSYGCGVAIDAPGAAVPIRTLRHIALHANLGGRSRWWSAWDARSCSRRGCSASELADAGRSGM